MSELELLTRHRSMPMPILMEDEGSMDGEEEVDETSDEEDSDSEDDPGLDEGDPDQ